MHIAASNAAARGAQTLEEAFPNVNARVKPIGSMVLVQLRTAKKQTAGGIILGVESQDADQSMIRVGKVIELGKLSYKKRDTMEEWPEGAWVKVGDFVRVPTMAGVDQWRVQVGEHDAPDPRGRAGMVKVKDWVNFVLFNDYDIKGLITGDPLEVVDYV